MESINKFISSAQGFPFLMNSKILKVCSNEIEMQVLFSSGDFYFDKNLSYIPMFIFIEVMGQGAEKILMINMEQKGKFLLTGVDQFIINEPNGEYYFDTLELNVCIKQKLGRYYQSHAIISCNEKQIASGVITHFYQS